MFTMKIYLTYGYLMSWDMFIIDSTTSVGYQTLAILVKEKAKHNMHWNVSDYYLL